MSIDLDKNRESIIQVYNDVLDDKTSTDWALLGYEGQTNTLKVVGSGDEGLEELAEDLNASKIMYGVVRLTDPKTSRTKIILINWQGEAAPNLRKGVCARHLPEVKRMLKGVHITVSARMEEDVETSVILSAVAKATATEYNFSERSEIPEKNMPVGTNYKRTNPQKEIDANKRNRFWEEQEAEEKIRKELEIKKREEEAKLLEKERMDREVRESKLREQINKDRNAKIVAGKKAETLASERTHPKEDVKVWEKEVESQHTEEIERARRADQMRLERKKEAESLIGKSTHLARSMFEPQPCMQQNFSTSYQQVDHKNRPPRVLKDFTPAQTDTSSNPKENLAPKRSIGKRWPPLEAAEVEEEKPHQAVKVPGRISDWKPQNEDAVIQSNQAVRENQSSLTNYEFPSSSTSQDDYRTATHFTPTSPLTEVNNASAISPSSPSSYLPHSPTRVSVNKSSHNIESTYTTHSHEPYITEPPQKSEVTSGSDSVATSITKTIHTTDSSSYQAQSSSFTNQTSITQVTESPSSPVSHSHKTYETRTPTFPKSPSSFSSPEHLNGMGSHANFDPYSNGISQQKLSDVMLEDETTPYQEDIDSFAMTYEVDGVEYQILPEHGLCARALYDYQAADETEITFDPGDIITNIDQIDIGWWQGVNSLGIFGLFPANYVELINGTKSH